MTVDAADPGKGEPSVIRSAATRRANKAADLRVSQATLVGARADATGSGWTGQAQIAFVDAVDQTLPDVALLADGLDAQASALNSYATAVQSIKDRQMSLQSHRDSASRELETAQWRVDDARTQYACAVSPVAQEDSADRVRRFQQQIDGQQSVLTEVQRAWDGLVQERATADAVCIASVTGPTVLGKLSRLAVGTPTTPDALVAAMAGLSASDLRILLMNDPARAQLLARADAPSVVAWWNSLDPTAREAVAAAIPAVIGNLDGIPYGVRDKANRTVLKQRIADARKALSDAQSPLPWWELLGGQAVVDAKAQSIAGAQKQLDAVLNINAALNGPSGGGMRHLISLTSDQPPLAAVAIGNLDTAQNVTFAVPGMGTDTADMTGWAGSAQNVYTAQGLVDGVHTHAVVAWIGYKTPPVPGVETNFDVLDTGLAKAGGNNLADAIRGLDATRTVSPPQVNVLAHSYGTTTAAFALSSAGAHVDTFVSVGSAGLPQSTLHASDLHADHVYAGQARNVLPFLESGEGDQWAWIGRDFGNHPVDPSTPEFGGKTFGTDTGGDAGTPVDDHSTSRGGGGYLDMHTESLRNVALATTGHGDRVTVYVPKGLPPLEQGLCSPDTIAMPYG